MKTSITFAILICLSMSSLAHAAKKKKPQVYAATEDTPNEEVIASAPGYTGNTTLPAAPIPAPIQVQSSNLFSAPKLLKTAPMAASKYDAVPNDQTEPLLRRLKLVEELVEKYGRAYDYKTLTVTQLQTILADLNNHAAENAELNRRMNARTEIKKEVQAQAPQEDIPAPESDNSIGTEAPQSGTPFQSGGGMGADSLAPSNL